MEESHEKTQRANLSGSFGAAGYFLVALLGSIVLIGALGIGPVPE